jgi:membrane-bound metal-dependent hydrolase YbcI (DUF457 family)
MMGKSHALSGVLAVTAGAAYLTLDPLALITAAMLVPGSSLLPDIDHARSTVSRTYGPITRGFSHLTGHREITHSVPGVLMLGTVLAGCVLVRDGTAGPVLADLPPAVQVGTTIAAYAFLCGVLILVLAAFVRLFRDLPGRYGSWFRRSWFDDLAPVPVVLSIVVFSDIDLSLAPVAIMIGCVIHMLGDMITKMGLPIMWPLSKRKIKLASIRAGGKIEKVVIVPAMILGVVWCLGVLIMPGTLEFVDQIRAWW